jgi:hypothetical protein
MSLPVKSARRKQARCAATGWLGLPVVHGNARGGARTGSWAPWEEKGVGLQRCACAVCPVRVRSMSGARLLRLHNVPSCPSLQCSNPTERLGCSGAEGGEIYLSGSWTWLSGRDVSTFLSSHPSRPERGRDTEGEQEIRTLV